MAYAHHLQAHIERFIQCLQQNGLENLIVFGEKHSFYLISEYVGHFRAERPHHAMGNIPLT